MPDLVISKAGGRSNCERGGKAGNGAHAPSTSTGSRILSADGEVNCEREGKNPPRPSVEMTRAKLQIDGKGGSACAIGLFGGPEGILNGEALVPSIFLAEVPV